MEGTVTISLDEYFKLLKAKEKFDKDKIDLENKISNLEIKNTQLEIKHEQDVSNIIHSSEYVITSKYVDTYGRMISPTQYTLNKEAEKVLGIAIEKILAVMNGRIAFMNKQIKQRSLWSRIWCTDIHEFPAVFTEDYTKAILRGYAKTVLSWDRRITT